MKLSIQKAVFETELYSIQNCPATTFKKNIENYDFSIIRNLCNLPAEEDESNTKTFRNKANTIRILKKFLNTH